MSSYRPRQTNAQTLSGVAMVLVVVGILFVVIGMTTETFAMAGFGAVLFGLALVAGIVGVGMHAFRR